MATSDPTFPLAPAELKAWLRFSTVKGGLGTGVASKDVIATNSSELMFEIHDRVVILFVFSDGQHYLGECEGVVGRLRKDAVRLEARLKQLVLTPRRSPRLSEPAPEEHRPLARSTLPSSRSLNSIATSSSSLDIDAFPLPLPRSRPSDPVSSSSRPIQATTSQMASPPRHLSNATSPKTSPLGSSAAYRFPPPMQQQNQQNEPSPPRRKAPPLDLTLALLSMRDSPSEHHDELEEDETIHASRYGIEPLVSPRTIPTTIVRSPSSEYSDSSSFPDTPATLFSPSIATISPDLTSPVSSYDQFPRSRKPSAVSEIVLASSISVRKDQQLSPVRAGWVTPPPDKGRNGDGEDGSPLPQILSAWSPKSPSALAAFFGSRKKIDRSVSGPQVANSIRKSLGGRSSRSSKDSDFSPGFNTKVHSTSRSLDYGSSRKSQESQTTLGGDNRYVFSAADAVLDSQASEIAWLTALNSMHPTLARGDKKLRLLARSGVTPKLRGRVWRWLTESESESVAGLYDTLYKKPPLPVYRAIDRDMLKTFLDHPHFALDSPGRDDLRNILYAIAQYDPTLGHSASSSHLAGIILLQMPESPESAFWMMIALIKRFGFYRQYDQFSSRLDALNNSIMDQLLEQSDKKLAKRFSELAVAPYKPLLAFYSSGLLPWNTTLRLLDLLFFDDIAYSIALAILRLSRNTLLDQCKTKVDVENYFQSGRKEFERMTPELLLPVTLEMAIKEDKLAKVKAKAEKLIAG